MLKNFCKWLIWSLITLTSLLCCATWFVTADVTGSSMYPTYRDGDFVLCLRKSKITHSDIVAIYSDELNKILCKRVIGLPGDSVVISGNTVSVNGAVLSEPYLKDLHWSEKLNVKVPDEALFLLGDNRSDSRDSRELGCLPIHNVRGICVLDITKVFGLTRDGFKIILPFIWVVVLVGGFRRGKQVTD